LALRSAIASRYPEQHLNTCHSEPIGWFANVNRSRSRQTPVQPIPVTNTPRRSRTTAAPNSQNTWREHPKHFRELWLVRGPSSPHVLRFPRRTCSGRQLNSRSIHAGHLTERSSSRTYREVSMNVTLLISFSVVNPVLTLSRADSRRKRMPSSRAARRISEVGFLSRIISRIRSLKSSNS